MEEFLKKELQTNILKKYGHTGGGNISSGEGYTTDQGNVFIKINDKPGARLMFDGEFAGLAAMRATNTVYCPKPIKVLDKPGSRGVMFVAEYVDMTEISSYEAELGDQLARMHLHNSELKKKWFSQEGSVHMDSEGVQAVNKFGFHVTTCCGLIPQDNTWQDDWVEFLVRQKLKPQFDMIEQEYSDREAIRLWSELQETLPGLFKGVVVEPALLHGDLHSKNASDTKDGPVIFDPATFYGHHEYELAIAGMFKGFSHKFYNAYHKHIPKEPGFEQRLQLYQLFHYLNHWNHFGTGYRGQSIGIMKKLTRT